MKNDLRTRLIAIAIVVIFVLVAILVWEKLGLEFLSTAKQNTEGEGFIDSKPLKEKESTKKFSNGETKCREYLEHYFQAKFPSIRPDFLRNPKTNRNLELDCYNKEYKLALEYNGIQHYQYTPRFHKSKREFKDQEFRDHYKEIRCRELGIYLIIVPYTVELSKIPDYIYENLPEEYRSCDP